MLKIGWLKLCSYAVCAIPIVLILIASVQNLTLDWKYASVLYFGRNIGSEQIIAPVALKTFVSSASLIVTEDVCRSDVLKAGLAIRLANLDRIDSINAYGTWQVAAADAITYIEHAITCLPTDGNLWLALATVIENVAESPDRIFELVARSQQLSPADSKLIFARLSFYNRLGAATLLQLSPVVFADLELGLEHNSRMVRRILENPSRHYKPYILTAIKEKGLSCPESWNACRQMPLE